MADFFWNFGGRAGAAQPVGKLFDFTQGALDPELTYTRSDNNIATQIDSNGKMQLVPANIPRFRFSGGVRRYLVEPSRTNKLTCNSINPTSAAGFTIASGTGTIGVINKATELAAAGLDQICTNGTVFDFNNTAGTGTLQVRSSVQVGNLNPHSISAYILCADSLYCGTLKITGSTEQALIQQSGTQQFQRYVVDNITPNNSVRQMEWNIPQGRRIFVILPQLEEGPYATSPIVTAGAAAARQADKLGLTNLNTRDWFNENAGTIIWVGRFFNDGGFGDQYAFIASAGTGLTEAYGAYMVDTRSKIKTRARTGNADYQTVDVNGALANQLTPLAVSWNNTAVKAVNGACYSRDGTLPNAPTGLTHLQIGGRTFSSDMFGEVEKLIVYKQSLNLSQMAKVSLGSSDRAMIIGGQSNGNGYFNAQIGNTNGGEKAMISALNNIWPSTRNWVLNGTTPGEGLLESDNTGEWWYSISSGTFGVLYQRWEEMARAYLSAGGDIRALLYDGHESSTGASQGDLTTGFLAVFNAMRNLVQSYTGSLPPVVWIPLGARGDMEQVAYQTQRDLQRTLAATHNWLHIAPEKFHQPLADQVHLTDAGYAAQAPLVIRKALKVAGETITGPVDGSSISGASRSGTTVTVTLAHESGITDFTPVSNIAGFKFFDNATEIAITAAVRTNATTITLTLASTPTGSPQTLYYGYAALYGITQANLVRGNDANQLPLRSARITM
jgi:hypothetical protein